MPLSYRVLRHVLQQGPDAQKQSIVSGGVHELTTRHDFTQPPPEETETKPDLEMKAAKQALLDTARQEAQAILETARQQAMDMARKAQLQSAQAAKQAKEQAAEQGYDQGWQEGLAAARADAEVIRAKARQVLEDAEKERRQKLEAVQGEVLQLAIDMAEKILQLELTTNQNVVLSIAEEALQLVTNRESVVLWVHPLDKQLCQDKKERLLSMLPPQSTLQIMTDEDITQGGCIVETTHGRVDASIESKWENLIQGLLKDGGNYEQ